MSKTITIETPISGVQEHRRERVIEILRTVLAARQDDESWGDTEFVIRYKHGMPCLVEVKENVTHKLE